MFTELIWDFCVSTSCVCVDVGVWDVMSNVEVAEFIRKKIASNMKPPLVCGAIPCKG